MSADFKPADHILDEFLGGHQVRTTVAEFSGLLKELRSAIAKEVAEEVAHAIEAKASETSYTEAEEVTDHLLQAARLAREIGGQS